MKKEDTAVAFASQQTALANSGLAYDVSTANIKLAFEIANADAETAHAMNAHANAVAQIESDTTLAMLGAMPLHPQSIVPPPIVTAANVTTYSPLPIATPDPADPAFSNLIAALFRARPTPDSNAPEELRLPGLVRPTPSTPAPPAEEPTWLQSGIGGVGSVISGAASVVGAVIDGIQQQVKDAGEGVLGLMDFDQNVRINRGKNTHLVNVLSSPTSSDQEVRDVLEERKHVFTQSTAAGLEFLATTPISVAMQARMAGITAGGMAAGDAAKLIEIESLSALKLESVVAKAATVVEKAEFAAASAAGTIEKAELAAGRAITKFEGAAAKAEAKVASCVDNLAHGQLGCFAAGTRLLTPQSDKAIEDFGPGDWVLSAPEDDPNGEIIYQQVEEVFRNFGQVLLLNVSGKTIRTSGEHPFYVENNGWTKAEALHPGDLLRSHDGHCNAVESITLLPTAEPLYNLRVANDHTYFVGERAWYFSAWSHNNPCPGIPVAPNPAWQQGVANSTVLSKRLGIQQGSGLAAHHIVPGTHSRAATARAILGRYQIDINSAENGVALIGGRGRAQSLLPRHHSGGGLHTHSGIDAVTLRLQAAISGVNNWAVARQNVVHALSSIRDEILLGTFP